MRYFSYIITFFAHPIWFPIYGAMLVLFQIPFSPSIEIVKYTWLLLLLITVALPTLTDDVGEAVAAMGFLVQG